MRSDAFITVYCDRCQVQNEEISLTATARGYDDRGIDDELESLGWKTGTEDVCPDCAGENEDEGDEDQDEAA